MFKKRNQDDTAASRGREPNVRRDYRTRQQDRDQEKPGSRPDASAVINRQPTPPVDPSRHRRPQPQSEKAEEVMSSTTSTEGKRLIVGKDISLSGEIKNCETLVVEGKIEAQLADTETLEITDSGLFKGSASINEATVAGRFEGDLTVKGCLVIRGTGLVTGTVRYGELQIERGGRLTGDIDITDSPGAKAEAAPKPAAAKAEAESQSPATEESGEDAAAEA